MQNHQVNPDDIVIAASQISEPTAAPRQLTINELAAMIAPIIAGSQYHCTSPGTAPAGRPMGAVQQEVCDQTPPYAACFRTSWYILNRPDETIEHRFSWADVDHLEPCSIEDHITFPLANEPESALYSIPGLFLAYCQGVLTSEGLRWLLDQESLWGDVSGRRARIRRFAKSIRMAVYKPELRNILEGRDWERIANWSANIIDGIDRDRSLSEVTQYMYRELPASSIRACAQRTNLFEMCFEHCFCDDVHNGPPTQLCHYHRGVVYEQDPQGQTQRDACAATYRPATAPAEGLSRSQSLDRSYNLGISDEKSFNLREVMALQPCQIEPFTTLRPGPYSTFSIVGLTRALRDGVLTPAGYQWLAGKQSLWHGNPNVATRYAMRFVRAVQAAVTKRMWDNPELCSAQGTDSLLQWCTRMSRTPSTASDRAFFSRMSCVPAEHLGELADSIVQHYNNDSRSIRLP